MNRNTIIAVLLSMFVLFSYEVFFVAPSRAKAVEKLKLSKNNDNIPASLENSSIANTTPSIPKVPTIDLKEAEISKISTKSFNINAINVGGALHNVEILPQHHKMPLFDILSIQNIDNQSFDIVSSSKDMITYSFKNSSLEILKKYTFENNTIRVRMEIFSKDGSKYLPIFEGYEIDASRLETADKREAMLDEYSYSLNGSIFRKGSASKFSPKESKVVDGAVNWIAFRDHYNAVVIKPQFETKAVEIKQLTDLKLTSSIHPAASLSTYDFIIYIGPQNKTLLAATHEEFSKVVAFSSFLPLEWISQAIFHLTLWIHNIVKSWGVSIIVIGMLIYGMTYPLTIKSMASMRRMQQVQPKILALRERFKNDPQKLNLEIVEIYKREKINPFGGCLPMLLQMPFFMAIYQVLWRAHYFQGESFLWIRDLSQPDRLFTLPFSIPFLGSDFNILPLVMGGVMFWQQKLSAQATVITDDTQAAQQKIMTIVFPIFITFIFYKFASSLSLYFTMFYFFSAVTQWHMTRTK